MRPSRVKPAITGAPVGRPNKRASLSPHLEESYRAWAADPNPRTLERLLVDARPILLKACRGVFRDDEAAAEDAAQDALLRLVDRGLSKYDGRGTFRNYVNRLGFHWAVEVKRRKAPVFVELGTSGDQRDEPEPTREDGLVQDVDREAIRSAFRHLWRTAPQYAQPLEWFFYDQLSVFEIAHRLGVSAVAARMRMFRGRRRIERYLEAVGYRPPENLPRNVWEGNR